MSSPKNITLIATAAFGLEALLKREIQELGFTKLMVADGKVELSATLADIPRLNIHLRIADRVLLKMAEFPAADFDQLFDKIKTLPWEDWLTKEAKITVVGRSVKSKLMSVRTCQSMIKKAVVVRFQEKFRLDRLPESGPEFTINFSIFKDVAQVALDTTGPGLNKRGYRIGVGEAPLRENLAAALVLFSQWNGRRGLIDPMCGSGTILIEAAMIARNIAPGIHREFAAQAWPAIDAKLWEAARQQARAAILPTGNIHIKGFDKDSRRITDAMTNAKRVGVDKDINFAVADIKELRLEEEAGVVITNPPYGMNIGELRELPPLYEALNKTLEKKPGWALYLLTADKSFPRYFKRARPEKIRKLYNGPIEANFFSYVASPR